MSLRSLQSALDQQKETRHKLGDILIHMGVVTKEQILMALHRQQQMRRKT